MPRRSLSFALLSLAVAAPLVAQPPGRGGGAPVQRQGLPIDPAPEYVRTTPPADPTIQKLWEEGMGRSQAGKYAQQLLDSVGPRLTGSPNMTRGQDWLLATYKQMGVTARKEQYGTWNSWQRGAAFAQLTAPRVKPLDARCCRGAAIPRARGSMAKRSWSSRTRRLKNSRPGFPR